jgi:hypothetical protein
VSPQKLKDYRPISLVGSLYKIVAKVLARRLKLVLHGIISESQSGFLSERSILDGIVSLNEVVDDAKRQKKGCLLFKPDF